MIPMHLIAFFIAGLLAGGEGRPLTGTVQSGGQPLSGALVRIQGADEAVKTGDNGRFRLTYQAPSSTPVYVAAGHEGYYNNRVKVEGSNDITIELRPLPLQDNPEYVWQDPRPNQAQPDNCGNCHSTIYSQWQADIHSKATIDPLVMTLYTGADIKGIPDRGPGYKRDWNDEGNCATCHAPTASIDNPHPAGLNEIHAQNALGVTCDVCHKIRDMPAALSSPTIADLRFLRPTPGARLNFGPFDDSTFPNEVPDFAYSALFKDSRLCAACHDGRSWGVPIYATYSEWKASPYNAAGIQCQDCHMRSTGKFSLFADEDRGGKARRADRIAFHGTLGTDQLQFLRSAVRMETIAHNNKALLTVQVQLTNVAAGHNFPTGQPLRNVLLLVKAEDEQGRPLTFLTGERVPVWGGAGSANNDYAGHPGKGFAKVLQTLNEYQRPAIIAAADAFAEFPAPQWRRCKILSDNRIAPQKTDASTYVFALRQAGKVHVETLLIYRRAFKPLADVKGWSIPDVMLASYDLTLNVAAQ